jgi:S-adenosylmethionine synthetase
LKNPIYEVTASYGHVGREPFTKEVEITHVEITKDGNSITECRKTSMKKLEFFTWEKLDYVDKVKQAFGI